MTIPKHFRDKKGQFKKGMPSWNKGLSVHLNTGRTHFKKGQSPANIKEKPSYSAMHKWIDYHLGQVKNSCEHCGKLTTLHWANVSGEYKREFSDWLRLCAKCHWAYDDIANKIWATRRANKA